MSTISLAGVRENGTKSTSAMEGVFCTIYIPLTGLGEQRVHLQWSFLHKLHPPSPQRGDEEYILQSPSRERGTKSTSTIDGVSCMIYIPLQENIPLPGKGEQRVHPHWREFSVQFTFPSRETFPFQGKGNKEYIHNGGSFLYS